MSWVLCWGFERVEAGRGKACSVTLAWQYPQLSPSLRQSGSFLLNPKLDVPVPFCASDAEAEHGFLPLSKQLSQEENR